MLLRGFAKGIPTKWLTDEMDLAYPSVLKRRHRIQEAVQNGERVGLPERCPEGPEEDSEEDSEEEAESSDQEVEVDEMYQHAGEKKGIRTWIPMIRPARGQISSADEERMRMTASQLSGWSLARPDRPASRFVPTQQLQRSRRSLRKRPGKRRSFTPMKTARTSGLKMTRNRANGWRSTTPPVGPPTGMGTEFGRYT